MKLSLLIQKLYFLYNHIQICSTHFELGASLRYEPEQPDLLAQGRDIRIQNIIFFGGLTNSDSRVLREFGEMISRRLKIRIHDQVYIIIFS